MNLIPMNMYDRIILVIRRALSLCTILGTKFENISVLFRPRSVEICKFDSGYLLFRLTIIYFHQFVVSHFDLLHSRAARRTNQSGRCADFRLTVELS